MKGNYCSLTVLLFVLSFCFTGCTTYNAATGRNEFIAIGTSEEISLGQNVHSQIEQNYKISNNTELNERLNRIGQRIAQVSDRQDYQYNFYVVDKDEMNAFTTPGGNIYFYSGLLNKLKRDDQIAAVLAHEIGHCAAKHTVKKYQAALGYDLISTILLGQIDSQANKQLAAISSNAMMGLISSSYGRKDEYEADKLAVKYMYFSGYDLNGIIEAFEILKKESQETKTVLLLRSHPYLDDRIKEVQQEIAAVKQKYPQ